MENGVMRLDIGVISKELKTGYYADDNIATFYVKPIYNGNLIVGFKEIITGKELVKRIYASDGIENFAFDILSIYDTSKAFHSKGFEIGDLQVKILGNINLSALNRYMSKTPEIVEQEIAEITERKVVKENDLTKFSKKKVSICYLDDDFLLVEPIYSFIMPNKIVGFREIISKQRLIKRIYGKDSYSDILLTVDDMDIPSVKQDEDIHELLTNEEINEYLNKSTNQIEAIILHYWLNECEQRRLELK